VKQRKSYIWLQMSASEERFILLSEYMLCLVKWRKTESVCNGMTVCWQNCLMYVNETHILIKRTHS